MDAPLAQDAAAQPEELDALGLKPARLLVELVGRGVFPRHPGNVGERLVNATQLQPTAEAAESLGQCRLVRREGASLGGHHVQKPRGEVVQGVGRRNAAVQPGHNGAQAGVAQKLVGAVGPPFGEQAGRAQSGSHQGRFHGVHRAGRKEGRGRPGRGAGWLGAAAQGGLQLEGWQAKAAGQGGEEGGADEARRKVGQDRLEASTA